MTDGFNKNLNISYIDDNLEAPTIKLALKHCLCSYYIYFAIYVLLVNNPFFSKYFVMTIRYCYEVVFFVYIIFAPIVYLIFRPKSLYNSHSIEIYDYFVNFIYNRLQEFILSLYTQK